MSLKFLSVAAVLSMGLVGAASAHHAVNAQFDVSKNVAAVGVLDRVELINPHTYMYFTIKDATGKARVYSMETGAPIALKRAGLSVRDNMKNGDTYKLVYSPSRNGSPTGLLTSITLPDGKFIAFGGKNNVDAARELNK